MDSDNSTPGVLPDTGSPYVHNGHRSHRSTTAANTESTRLDETPSAPAGLARFPFLAVSGSPASITGQLSSTGELDDVPPSFAHATSYESEATTSSINAAATNGNPAPVLDSRIVLRVGEKQFFTTRTTLAESQLLATLLSTCATHNGEYFLDADPDMFVEILRFLRTRRFPLFYDHTVGYDIGRYGELLVAAQFYQIPTLETWLEKKRYLGAVVIRTEHKAYTLYGTDQIIRMHELCWGLDQHGRLLTIQEKNGKAWACPNKFWRHDGSHMACVTAKCRVSRAAEQPKSPMRILDITALVTRIEVRGGVLSAGTYIAGPPPYEGRENA
ncbi:hypothetical protein NQ176_g9670 [Zarea fungicola]|uniref:Uncharacterized protein n=1 Tax=Zarea fungicola TaxID=93591 RepID=A0ACC1MMC9_9HYPO|nr:hypothetical protein NQ176_g9670 [Lecanicillium fungicola]